MEANMAASDDFVRSVIMELRRIVEVGSECSRLALSPMIAAHWREYTNVEAEKQVESFRPLAKTNQIDLEKFEAIQDEGGNLRPDRAKLCAEAFICAVDELYRLAHGLPSDIRMKTP
jgi:hypothetical protein